MNDHELLREFVQGRSQDAFRQLVERHIGMVYATACRVIRDAQLAQDVVQGVFTTLAQKSATITTSQVIGGWLYNTARNLALHTVRTEQRRRERELTAVVMQTLNANTDNDRIFEQLEPAMAELEPGERDAVVLRFLENRSFREVGTELGVSEDAARMRVNRALDRLRTVLDGKGVGVSAIVLTAALGAATAHAVPVGLTATVTASALTASGAASLTATQSGATFVHWINAKVAAAIAGAALVAGTGTYIGQQKQIDQLRTQNQALEAQQVKLTTDVETAAAASRSNQDELERQRKNSTELLRLRNEVSQLRRDAQEQASAAAKAKGSSADLAAVAESMEKTNDWSKLPGLTNLVFESDVQEFIAKRGETNGTFTFRFKNVSPVAVEITSVHPSCGCTTVELPKLPWRIEPGAQDVLKATMSFAGKPPGTIAKTLTVIAAAGIKVLQINTVIPPDALGPFIPKEKLSDVGYATPDAAFQTIIWLMMNGDYDQIKTILSPELAKNEPDTPEARAQFESRRQLMAPLFKGMQIVAQKTLPDGKVELKIKQEYDPAIAQVAGRELPEYSVQPMVKIGNEWKFGGSTREYSKTWDEP